MTHFVDSALGEAMIVLMVVTLFILVLCLAAMVFVMLADIWRHR